MNWLRAVSLVGVLAVTASACGGDDDDNDGPALSVSADAVSLAPGETKTTQVSISRTAISGAVVLEVSGAPAGITASVDPATATADTSTLTVTADTSATAQSFNLVLTATADSRSATTNVAVSVVDLAPINLTGTIVNGPKALPINVTEVRVWGRNATSPSVTAVTPSGTFSLANVQPPYDAMIVTPTGKTLVLGLTRSDPVLIALLGNDVPLLSGSVSGGLGGAAALDTDTIKTTVLVDCPTAAGVFSQLADSENNFYTMNLTGVLTSPTTQCVGKALRYDPGTTGFLSQRYLGYGQSVVSVTADANTTHAFRLQDNVPTTRQVPVHVTLPSGAAPAYLQLQWFAGAHSYEPIGDTPSNTFTNFNLTVPNDPNITLCLAAGPGAASAVTVRCVTPDVTALDFVTTGGSSLLAPADTETTVDPATATFSWTAVPQMIFGMSLNSIPLASDQPWVVISAASSVSMAKLASRGLQLVGNTTYAWTGFQLHSYSSIDDFSTMRGTIGGVISSEGSITTPVTRTFATRP